MSIGQLASCDTQAVDVRPEVISLHILVRETKRERHRERERERDRERHRERGIMRECVICVVGERDIMSVCMCVVEERD